MRFYYMTQPPKRFTFEQPKLKKFVELNLRGKTLNLFAGKTALKANETRVDKNKAMPADYHMDALEFLKMAIQKGMRFDSVVLDPPYSMRKSREKYQGKWIGAFRKIKDLVPDILNDNGVVITLGYDSVGMSRSRGFKKIALGWRPRRYPLPD
jgi:hypothetical protein